MSINCGDYLCSFPLWLCGERCVPCVIELIIHIFNSFPPIERRKENQE